MKILVTGGAGFIGGNFVHYMIKNHPGYKIICVDALTYAGNIETLSTIKNLPSFEFYKADITDREKIFQIFEKTLPDIAVNFAAESHVDRSLECPELFLKTNILGTNVIMDACMKYGTKRFHQVSTDEVYGDLKIGNDALPFTESSPLRPSNPYSASKASADLLVGAYHRTFGLPATVSRCTNNYGQYQFPEKLIPLMIINALNDKPLPVYGNGENVRDWIFVEDHCRAIDMIIHDGKIGEIYNIGANNEMKNIDIVKIICQRSNRPESMIKFVEDRKGHDLRYALDTSKIRTELGWEPNTDFLTGINNTIDWYINNYSWCENILNGKYKTANENFIK